MLKKTASGGHSEGDGWLILNEETGKKERNHGKIRENCVWGRGNNKFKGPVA